MEEPQGVVLVQAEEMSAVRTPVAPEQVRTFAHQMEDPVLPARWAILDFHDGQVLGLLRGRGLETPQRPAKDPAPMLRADTTAPVSMTKRNLHALQRMYTKLLAWATALTSAVRHFPQGVTGRPP